MKNINNQNRHFFMHYDDTCNHDTSCVGYEAIFANNFQQSKQHTYVYVLHNSNVFFVEVDILQLPYIVIKQPVWRKMSILPAKIMTYNLHWIFSTRYKNHFHNQMIDNNQPVYDIEKCSNRYYISECSHKHKLSDTLHISRNQPQNIDFLIPPSPPKSAPKRKLHECFCKGYNFKDFKKTILSPSGKKEMNNNLQYLLQSIGLYDQYKDIFLFISKLKTISYDLETVYQLLDTNVHTPDITLCQTRKSTLQTVQHPLAISFSSYFSDKTMKRFVSQFYGRYIHDLSHVSANTIKSICTAVLKMDKNRYNSLIESIMNTPPEYKIYTFHDKDMEVDFFYNLLYVSQTIFHLSLIFVVRIMVSFEMFLQKDHKPSMYGKIRLVLKRYMRNIYIFGFNSSKFDSVFLYNKLIPFIVNKHFQVSVAKKNQSISNLMITKPPHIWIYPKKGHGYVLKKILGKGILFNSIITLNFRDIRNILPFGSLQNNADQYGLSVNKLHFPYGFLTSKHFLQSITIHNINHVSNDSFWIDHITGKFLNTKEKDLICQDFQQSSCPSLFHYLLRYLDQDVLVLHTLLIKVMNTFYGENINFILQNRLTLSSISYTLFFMGDKMNKLHYIAPCDTNNDFINDILHHSICGGFTCSNIHGDIDSSTYINQGLKYKHLDPKIWPFASQDLIFDQKVKSIFCYDIRSMYADQYQFDLPTGPPLIYTKNDEKMILSYSQTRGKSEYFAVQCFINEWKSKNDANQVLRVCHENSVGGQVCLKNFLDCVIFSYKNDTIHISAYNYHSTFYHGHSPQCPEYIQNVESESTLRKDADVITFLDNLHKFYSFHNLKYTYTYTTKYDCDFSNHEISMINPLLHHTLAKKYNYNIFLDMILKKELQGFLVCRNLELKKKAQFDAAGFCIFRYENLMFSQLSPYTQNLMNDKNKLPHSLVIAAHKFPNVHVLHTSYFLFLNSLFGFQPDFSIVHLIVYMHLPLLKERSTLILRQRQLIKDELLQNPSNKSVLERRAQIYKLLLNSLYGYNLLDKNKTSYRHFESCLKKNALNRTKPGRYESLMYPINQKYVFLQHRKNPGRNYVNPSIGSAILNLSKICLLRHKYHFLRYCSPNKLQLLYSDTDSFHVACSEVSLDMCVPVELKKEWEKIYDIYFNPNVLSGQLILEYIASSATYYGEKAYKLDLECNEQLLRFKGIPQKMLKGLEDVKVSPSTIVSYNHFKIDKSLGIVLNNFVKQLNNAVIPKKRYFETNLLSRPLF